MTELLGAPGLDFRLLGVVGKGGMGTVHRAETRDGLTVAVKLLTPRARADVERFLREGELLAQLSHDHIVRHVAHGVLPDGDAYLAMEWLDGEDLAQRLARGALSLDESLALARQVAAALACAHVRGVVHRDVKPSNIFLVGGRADDVRVLDFGIARIAGAAGATRTGTVLGTPGYMAPEQARGERGIGAAVDIFGLGCVLYECLTGQPAFWAEHIMALLARILLEEPTPPGELTAVPAAVDALVLAMLSKDPTQRPADGAAALAALDGLATRDPGRPKVQAHLGEREQQWVSLVFARESASADTVDADTLDPAGSAVRGRLATLVQPFGANVVRLLDGTLVASLPGTGVPRDGAVSAARCALGLDQGLGADARVVVVTGRGVRGARVPLGAIIDQAVRLLAIPRSPDGPRLDATTAGLLDTRFAIGGDALSLTLRAEHASDEVPRRLLGQPSPCVGRDRELASLTALYDECAEEESARVALITAAPGAGKSRLRVELCRRLSEREPRPTIWLAHGDLMAAGSPRGLMVQLVRSAAGLHDGEPIDVLRNKLTARVARATPTAEVPRVAAFLGELASVPFPEDGLPALRGARRDPVALGDQIADAWEDFLAAELDAGPVVIVLEDLHWGDLPTVRACDRALRRFGRKPLAIIATARPEVHDVFPALWAGRPIEELRLGPLTPRAAERLVRGALGAAVSDDVVGRVVARAEGNAFVLEELVRAAAMGEAVPETALASTAARLGALPEPCRKALRAASVFGEAFWRGGVAALVGSDAIDGDIARLVEEEIVEPRAHSRFDGAAELRFRHALLRDAAYATLTPEDLVVGHRVAGEWLVGAGERDDVVLAEHFERGGDRRRAATHWAGAAQKALAGNDFEATVRHAERALDLGDGEAGAAACWALIADAQQWSGRYEEGLVAAARFGSLSPLGSADWHRAIMLQAICLQRLARVPDVAELADTVATTSPRPGAEPVRLEVLVRLAMRLNFYSDLSRVPRLLDLAEQIVPGDDADRAWLESADAIRGHLRGDLPVYLEHTERAAALLDAAGNARDALSQREDLGWWQQHAGQTERAEETSRRVVADAERMRLKRVETNARLSLMWQLSSQGRYDEALVEAQRLLALDVSPYDAAGTHIFIGIAMIESGRAAEAAANIACALEGIERFSSYYRLGTAFLAEVLLATGDREGACAAVETLESLMHGTPISPHFEVESRCSLARVFLGLGLQEQARAMTVDACERAYRLVRGFSDRAERTRALRNVAYHRRVVALARELEVQTPLLDDA